MVGRLNRIGCPELSATFIFWGGKKRSDLPQPIFGSFPLASESSTDLWSREADWPTVVWKKARNQ